jgi:hypothetical protein
MKAYPILLNKNFYYLEGRTYPFRQQIRELGGTWNGSRWIIPEHAIEPLHAIQMYWVEVDAHCHEDAGHAWASNADVKRGYVRTGCGLCDSSNVDAKIKNVVQ